MYVVTPFSPCFDDHQIHSARQFPGATFFLFFRNVVTLTLRNGGKKVSKIVFCTKPRSLKKTIDPCSPTCIYIYIYIDLLLFFSCLFEVIHFSIKVPSCRDPQLVPRSWRIATAASPSWAESSERRSVGTFSADGSDRSNDRSAFVGRVNSRWATSLLSYKWSDMVNPYKSRKIIGLGEQKSYNMGAPCPFYL